MGRRPKSIPDSIKCPNCGQLIPITETLHHQLTEQARAEAAAKIYIGDVAL